MSDADKVNVTTKLAGEQLALSRQWEQIGYALVATLLAILGVVVTNRSMFSELPAPWAFYSWVSVALFALSMAVLSLRYLLLSILYFHLGMTRLKIAETTIGGDANRPMADILKDQYNTPVQVNLSPTIYHLAQLLAGAAFMCAPLALIVITALIIAGGQMVKLVP